MTAAGFNPAGILELCYLIAHLNPAGIELVFCCLNPAGIESGVLLSDRVEDRLNPAGIESGVLLSDRVEDRLNPAGIEYE
jgi:hypothetical protein